MPRTPSKKEPKPLYSVHPGVAMIQKWIAELPQKTGRSLDEWVRVVREEGPATEKECRDWLKKGHGLGTNTAWWIAERAKGEGGLGLADDDPEAYLRAAPGYVDAMFAGPKTGLRPLYDRLLALGLGLGPDAKACPCKTIVPLYRNHVFAELKPTTRTRIDLGLALRDTPVTGRLIDTGGLAKKDRITRRIPITCPEEIDAEVERWLRTAYEMDA
jgi:hypothetical protein